MNSGLKKYLVLSTLILALTGCSTRPTYYIELKLPGEDAICKGVEIAFLSYDYGRVLDSLARFNNPGPRPDSTELMALLDEYRTALARQTRYADSVSTLREKLEKMDVKAIQYKRLYPIFAALEKAAKRASEQQNSVHERLNGVRTSYKVMLKDWEQAAYKGFDQFKEEIVENFPERKTKVETTDSDCMVKKLSLPYGDWWLYTEATIPGTNEKLTWDRQLPATGPDSLYILLDEGNAVREIFLF